ncbi:hypothetical protein BJY52DRAFT_247398 [Lactarius psammicola]|nr:hypothetical protein BJY52DRAFT_247398 [Lactarius psammicola]
MIRVPSHPTTMGGASRASQHAHANDHRQLRRNIKRHHAFPPALVSFLLPQKECSHARGGCVTGRGLQLVQRNACSCQLELAPLSRAPQGRDIFYAVSYVYTLTPTGLSTSFYRDTAVRNLHSVVINTTAPPPPLGQARSLRLEKSCELKQKKKNTETETKI